MYWVKSQEDNYKTFYADFESDVAKLPTTTQKGENNNKYIDEELPCPAGSKCFVIEKTEFYMLNNSDQWVKIGV